MSAPLFFRSLVYTLLLSATTVALSTERENTARSASSMIPDWMTLGESNEFSYDAVYSTVFDNAGNLYLFGANIVTGGLHVNSIGRWDGNKWSIAAPGIPGNDVLDIAFDRNDNMYAVGRFEKAGNKTVNHIAMWDGNQWNPVGNGSADDLQHIAIDSKGTIYVTAFTKPDYEIRVLEGNEWKRLGGFTSHYLVNMVFDDEDNLYVAGRFSKIDDLEAGNIARWDGEKWENVGNFSLLDDEGYCAILWLGYDDRGTLYAGGRFDHINSMPVRGIAQWDGTQWKPLNKGPGPGTYVFHTTCAMGPEGDLFLCGDLTDFDTLGTQYVVHWDGATWHPLSGDFTESPDLIMVDGNSTPLVSFKDIADPENNAHLPHRLFRHDESGWTDICRSNGLNGFVHASIQSGNGTLYVGGEFTFAGTSRVNHIAEWDGTEWHPLGDGIDCRVDALALDSSGNLYAGGYYDDNRENMGVMKWDGTNWTSLNGSDTSLFALYQVNALTVNNKGHLYAGGYTGIGPGILVWDGSEWNDIGAEIRGGGPVSAITFDKNGDMYIAGDFNRIDEMIVHSIAHWDGTTWNSLGGGMSWEPTGISPVLALVFDSKGDLYAGGKFEYAGDVQARNIARWDGTAWHALTSEISGQSSSRNNILSLYIDENDNIFAGGNFDTIGTVAAKNMAFWNGTRWNSIKGSVTSTWSRNIAGSQSGSVVASWSGCVYTLARYNDMLAVGGAFEFAGGEVSANFASGNIDQITGVERLTEKPSGGKIRHHHTGSMVSLTLGVNSPVETVLYTLSGREMYRTSTLLPRGTHTIKITTKKVPAGTYIVRVKAGKELLQYRLPVYR